MCAHHKKVNLESILTLRKQTPLHLHTSIVSQQVIQVT